MGLSFAEIKELIALLSASGVAAFDHDGLSVTFNRPVSPAPAAKNELVEKLRAAVGKATPGIATEKVPDAVVPQSLDEEMDRDKILFWSSGGEQSSVPLTDDGPSNDTPITFPGETPLPPPPIEGAT